MENDRVRETTRRSARWTYAEFARLPGEGSKRHEIIAGELVVTAAPRPDHQRVATRLVVALHEHVDAHNLGEVFVGPIDVLFAEGDYFEPDAVFVRSGREHIVSDRGLEEAPDLVVEIVTPSTAARDRGIKLDRYRLYGVPEYWIVDPDEGTLTVWRFADGVTEPRVLRAGDVLEWTPRGAEAGDTANGPALELAVASLFSG